MKLIGIVLAGGKSRRFGSPKAFASKDNKAFYTYSINALKPYISRLVIVTNPELETNFTSENITSDIIQDVNEYTGQGPLAGIYSAMDRYVGEWYIVLPIDVPFIESSVIERLIEQISPEVDAIVPVVAGKLQPLISIYQFNVKQIIQEQLDSGSRSVKSVLDNCRVKYVAIDEAEPFVNINSQLDYEHYIGKQNE
ncbi:molybdenum cofactor guanylyltransferase [Oceanobacillus arenosus]|uniref:Probable molybdenum cofactor guanylyltransferase n=1 Tax=Oceanobacillus arenosus TaxID=1229153 RepID=A0A3D8PYC9_9BACI|nr:molybdenum cofactor guanylyltransferase [Oceanobacillus arenosus]RDW20169.1 molybdenum cofactor guanylyltransferase [Oceanobacillus arenosus]